MENKSASLIVVSMGITLGGILPSWCGKQMAGNSKAVMKNSSTLVLVLEG